MTKYITITVIHLRHVLGAFVSLSQRIQRSSKSSPLSCIWCGLCYLGRTSRKLSLRTTHTYVNVLCLVFELWPSRAWMY